MIRHNTELTKIGHDFRQLKLSKNILFAGEKLNPQPHLRPHQRLDLRLTPKLKLQLRLGIPTTGTGTLIMVMAMADTMAIAILIMADITMANRSQEFQSLIFEISYYETIEHWREIWT